MKNPDLKKSMKYASKIRHLTDLFNSRKAELSAGYQGYHEILAFVDQCQRFGITDRGQEKMLDNWIELLKRWPFVGGPSTGPLSRQQHQRILTKHHFTCTVCGREADEVHHTIPRSQGGGNNPGNLTAVCNECHEKLHRRRC